jgi:hypothetical protein
MARKQRGEVADEGKTVGQENLSQVQNHQEKGRCQGYL